MQPTCEELLTIIEEMKRSHKEEVKQLRKEIETLRKELRKYVNENTPSGSIPPYLKKLEETVDKFASTQCCTCLFILFNNTLHSIGMSSVRSRSGGILRETIFNR